MTADGDPGRATSLRPARPGVVRAVVTLVVVVLACGGGTPLGFSPPPAAGPAPATGGVLPAPVAPLRPSPTVPPYVAAEKPGLPAPRATTALPASASPTAPAASTPAPPAAPFHVGLQVGHWHIADLPASLARLWDQTGAVTAGRTELSLNLDFARRTAALLEQAGVVVNLLPATVPNGYRADAFVAIHADANYARRVRGYKIAPPWRSGVAWRDAILTEQLASAYAAATGLPRDVEVTDNMRGYYAINGWMGDDSRISDQTPGVVVETGFMTSAADRAVLFDHPEQVASGLATGILAFLRDRAATEAGQRQAAAVAASAPTGCSAVVLLDDVPIRAGADPSASALLLVNRGTSLVYLDSTVRPPGPFTNAQGRRLAIQTGYYRVARPDGGGLGYINRGTVVVQLPSP